MRTARFWSVVAVVALGSVAGRWDSPIPPVPAEASTHQTADARSLPFAVELTVSGPDVMTCGDRAKFAATLRFSDGSTRDVTTSAEWSTSSEQVLTARDRGAGQAVAAGQSIVTARFGGRSAARSVRVVER